MRWSIRYKMLLLLAGVLLAAMGTYLYLAASLFSQDKLAYIYDLNASLVSSLTEQTRFSLRVLVKELNLVALQGDKSAAQDLFGREPDVLRVQIMRRHGKEWSLGLNEVHQQALQLAQWSEADLALVHKARPLPLDAIVSDPEFVYVQNSSVPPDAAVLTLAYRSGPDTVLVADFRHELLLRIFGDSKLHETFLIDSRGEIVAHPDGKRVIEHMDASSSPLVQAALHSDADEAVKEFVGDDKQEQIGAYGRVGLGRLWVVTQIPKAEALRASRDLLARSALFAVAILLVAVILSIFFSRLLTAPIRTLRQVAEEIGQGRFDVAVPVRSNDEIGDLARSFERMAHQLKETQAQLIQSEKMAAFGQLGAGITHEVKNPMTSIVGFTQLAQRSLGDPDKAAELLKMVEKEAVRCQEILVNFLKFARTSDAEFAQLQINDVVGEAARIVRHQLNIGGVKLELQLADDLPRVSGNAAELQQVLLNLAINAQQAMPSGGTVRMSTQLQMGGEVEIDVEDDGPGIPRALHNKIFEPFFTTKAPGEGTGLGLSVSFSIVKAHKGSIDVSSQEGKGTRFAIRLPTSP